VFEELQYSTSSIKILDGGINAYFAKFPLAEKDRKKPSWKLTGQSSGVRYAYNGEIQSPSSLPYLNCCNICCT
jgi:hypothetical protein